jgi:hypothetical protein
MGPSVVCFELYSWSSTESTVDGIARPEFEAIPSVDDGSPMYDEAHVMFVREDDTAVQSGCEKLPCRRRVTKGTSQESLVFFTMW